MCSNVRRCLFLLNQYTVFESSEILLLALRDFSVWGSFGFFGRQEVTGFDTRGLQKPLPLFMLLELSGYSPVVGQM